MATYLMARGLEHLNIRRRSTAPLERLKPSDGHASMRTFLGVTAATATIVLVRLLPFLPGRYDSLAVDDLPVEFLQNKEPKLLAKAERAVEHPAVEAADDQHRTSEVFVREEP